jgi:hypothetical protein
MAPCSGKPKCGCGCPSSKAGKKRKASKRKAGASSSKAGKKLLPSSYAGQRGSAVIQSFPGPIQPQFTPSFQTPIPSAVTKMTVEDIRKKEISTQTEDIKPEKKTRKPRTKVVLKPVEPQAKLEPIARRELSKSAIAAINRSQSARPIERVGNVVAFAPEPVEEPKPAKVEDIKPRGRTATKLGRPTKASKIAMSGSQPLISSLLPPLQNYSFLQKAFREV